MLTIPIFGAGQAGMKLRGTRTVSASITRALGPGTSWAQASMLACTVLRQSSAMPIDLLSSSRELIASDLARESNLGN